MLGEVLRRHLEWIRLHLETISVAEEGVAAERVDFPKSARRSSSSKPRDEQSPWTHELRASASVRAVKGIGVAEIERQVVLRVFGFIWPG